LIDRFDHHEERHYPVLGLDGRSENLCFFRPIIISIIIIIISLSTESCFVARISSIITIVIIITIVSISIVSISVVIVIDPKEYSTRFFFLLAAAAAR
jgi:hypothetical protein